MFITKSARRSLSLVFVLLIFISGCRKEEQANPGQSGRSGGVKENPKGTVELVFTYGSEKEKWVKDVTDAFHASNAHTKSGKSIHVSQFPMGSGECIDEILTGKRKAHITSPASAAFIKLGNAKYRAKTGKDLIPTTENLVLSPVVIAMWQPMAEALGWPNKSLGWSDILTVAKNPQGWAAYGHPEWGAFKFGHTHPEFSNSGLISLFAEVYAGAGKVSALSLQDVERTETAKYLSDIENSVVHYGSSTGFFGRKMFSNGPEYLSAAVLYENMVIESYLQSNRTIFPVVAIYPKEGTFWSDHPAGIVDADWVTPEHKEAAEQYLKYLQDRPQQEKALTYGFRPASVDIALGAPIDKQHGVDPTQPKTTLEVPSVEVMDAVTRLWHEHKKRSHVTLVFDTSGSMKEEDRIIHAREGASALLEILSDDDSFSLLPFSSIPAWAFRNTALKSGRTTAMSRIQAMFPSGGTALYDAISLAYDDLSKNPQTNRISAIVVLTDGEDTNSRTKLDQLLTQVRFDGEVRTTRVFTIGYGEGANAKVLESIADATQARFYKGTPENIESVFKEISTFF
ncbi:VWA domain-containing protein [bacterium]|nr:VWA domain-containing protein [bacterium]